MTDDPQIFLRALQSGCAAYGAAYVVSAICSPAWFLDTFAIDHFTSRFRRRKGYPNIETRPWYEIPLAIFTLIALGVLIYAASYAIVSIIPFSWGGENEDGDWESTRHNLQYGLAFFGSLGLATKLESNAEILVWGPVERKARQALVEAIQFARHHSQLANESIAKSVERKLAPDPYESDTFETRYAADLRQWVKDGTAGRGV